MSRPDWRDRAREWITCMETVSAEPTPRSLLPGLRLGVEEEFLVVDPATRMAAPLAAMVVDLARPRLGERVSGEITELQLETRTEPCLTLKDLADQLVAARVVVKDCARTAGLRVVASGTPVLIEPGPPPMTQGPRQDRGTATYRGLHDELAICALHVHVETASRERAILVGNHLRQHLPALLTLTANSPFWSGRDTGYASWRTMTWPRWPVAGPPPHFASAAEYDDLIEKLLAAGVLVDAGTIFWDIRPSSRYPTLEIRVADVPVTALESARFAVLVRALVAQAERAIDDGRTAPAVSSELMRAAYWRAARDGFAGEVIDLHTGRLIPARVAVARMVESARAELEATGDAEEVDAWIRLLAQIGTGAQRQREAAARRGQLSDVVDYLAEQADSPD